MPGTGYPVDTILRMSYHNPVAPNDSFFLKSVEKTFWIIQSIFRFLEMHFKRRYKICICSVILEQLESENNNDALAISKRFRKYKGFSIIFPKILDALILLTDSY